MIEILNELVNNRQILLFGIWYGLPITLILIILFFIKSSRDERGRAIIGKASIISMIVFVAAAVIMIVVGVKKGFLEGRQETEDEDPDEKDGEF